MFNPSRLRLARERRGLNKTRFAERLGVDLRSINAYERGEFPPSEENLARIAEILDFPVSFFFRDQVGAPLQESASFRSMARMTASTRNAALAAGSLAFELNDWIESEFNLPTNNLPDLRGENPEAAAATMRRMWGLGERPIKNAIHLLEDKGVRVFSLAERNVTVDAFSLWRNETPFMFLNTLKSAEHGRFDAAHELGHLVLHRHGTPTGTSAEAEADAFASAFLMPKDSMLAINAKLMTIDHLVRMKKPWNVSVAALNYRLHALGMTSEWQNRSLCIDIAKRGYRTKEPEGSMRETSQVLAKVFAALRVDGLTKSHIAERLGIHSEELDRMVFGLVLLALEGGNPLSSGSDRRAHLRVVPK